MTPEELSVRALDLKQMYESGELSQAEFKELVQNLIVSQSINNAALELEENITCRNVIVGVINMASLLA